ncbi:MAG: SBBP repeat-containing protein [Bacteroidota bacterium]
MKKIYILTVTVCLLNNITKAQEVWTWAKGGGGDTTDMGYDVATDLSGNIYITGSFMSDTIVIGTDTLISNGDYDVFLAKYDDDGNVLWARSFGGSDTDNGLNVSPDTLGNVYVTGYFKDSIFFAADTLVSAGHFDVFLVKFDVTGNPLWGVKGGGTGEERSMAISVDASGNVYITGKFFSPTSAFGSEVITNTDGGGSTDDIFVVKYDQAGNIIWAKSAGGTSFDRSFDIAADVFGNVYITGWFNSTTMTFDTTTLNNNGFFDFYILKYDSAGNEKWAKNAGGNMEDEGFGIITDPSGYIYVTGNFHSASITFDTITLTSYGDRDMFIVKYDSSGSVVWAKNAGGNGQDRGEEVAIDKSGNVIIAGWFFSVDMVLASDTMINYGERDIFVAKYDSSGNIIWGKTAGGSLMDIGNSITVDTSGNIYVGGYYYTTNLTFGTNITNNNGDRDYFLAKISECSLVVSLNDVSFCEGDSNIIDAGAGSGYSYLWSTGDSTQTITVTVSGTYTLTVTDGNGCQGSGSVNVTVNPTYSTNTSDTTICDNDSILIFGIYQTTAGTYYDSLSTVNGCDSIIATTLTINPLPPKPMINQNGNDLASSLANYYQWYYYDTLLVGETLQYYTATQSGFYSVMVTDANGCSSTSDPPYGVTISSIEDIAAISSFNVYPNPNTGMFTIELNIIETENIRIEIINILGQEIYTETLYNIKGNYKKKIDLKPNAAGIYNLQLINDKAIINKKLIIE